MFAYIKTEDVSVHSSSALADAIPPAHTAKQGSVYVLVCAFFVAGVQAELPADTEGRLYLRPQATTGNPHVTGVWSKQGTGSSTTYTFVAHLVGSPLDVAMAADADGQIIYDAEIEWVDPASPSTINKTVGHTVTVKRAVGTSAAAVTFPVRTARTIEVADNHAQLNAMGYNAYADMQTAVDAAIVLAPTAIAPVTIRLHNRQDDGFDLTASTDGLRIIGWDRYSSVIIDVNITGGLSHKLMFANVRVGQIDYEVTDPAGELELKVDNLDCDAINAPSKSVVVEGFGVIDVINTDAISDGGGTNDNGGIINVFGNLLIQTATAKGGNVFPDDMGTGGTILINDWCRVSTTDVTGGTANGSVTDSSLW
jgi:hypothetical protein